LNVIVAFPIAEVSALLFQLYFSHVVTNDTAVPHEAAAFDSYVVSVNAIVSFEL
jgi:ADP-heptose:LPS heptosyltransferase